jgi:hypothetical protein
MFYLTHLKSLFCCWDDEVYWHRNNRSWADRLCDWIYLFFFAHDSVFINQNRNCAFIVFYVDLEFITIFFLTPFQFPRYFFTNWRRQLNLQLLLPFVTLGSPWTHSCSLESTWKDLYINLATKPACAILSLTLARYYRNCINEFFTRWKEFISLGEFLWEILFDEYFCDF